MKKALCSLILYIFSFIALYGQTSSTTIEAMDFVRQPVQDILAAFARLGNTTILPDETVTGTTTFLVQKGDWESAFQAFLTSNNLFSWKENNMIRVSRIWIQVNVSTQKLTVFTEGAPPSALLSRLSRIANMTIHFENLPNDPVSIRALDMDLGAILNIIVQKWPSFQIEQGEGFFQIQRLASNATRRGSLGRFLTQTAQGFSLTGERVRFIDAVQELFKVGDKEFLLLKRGDTVIENINVLNKNFDEALGYLCDLGEASFTIVDGMYYILDSTRNDVLRKLATTTVLSLQAIRATRLAALIPASGSPGLPQYRIDKETNSVIVTGTSSEISAFQNLLRIIDKTSESVVLVRYDLRFISPDKILPLIPEDYKAGDPVLVPATRSFVMWTPQQHVTSVRQFINLVDVPSEAVLVNLKYLKADDLIKFLPPSVARDDLVLTPYPSQILFRGSDEKREYFLRELATLDRPFPQIRYDLLVVQYQDSQGLNWSPSLSMDPAAGGANTSVSGSLLPSAGPALGLNIDVFSGLGYQFSAGLAAGMTANKARILADTTLTGLSGQDLKFQNTNTFRYRDFPADADPNKTAIGVTREIQSGLLLTLSGWVSGDGMVTLNVSTTISQRGSDSSSEGNPPVTFEKSVTTTARTRSGEPVIIGGLYQRNQTEIESYVPILGQIPLLGYLFRSVNKVEEVTEFVVYIIPRVEIPIGDPRDYSGRFESFYRALGGP